MTDEPGPKIGDGTSDAASAIGEHAFRAGWDACLKFAFKHPGGHYEAGKQKGWSNYDPPEYIKELA